MVNKMGALVSSRVAYIEEHPDRVLARGEVLHEVEYLRKREQIGMLVAITAVVLGLIMFVGTLGGGAFFAGALFGLAGAAAGYAYCCRLAQAVMLDRLIPQQTPKN